MVVVVFHHVVTQEELRKGNDHYYNTIVPTGTYMLNSFSVLCFIDYSYKLVLALRQ